MKKINNSFPLIFITLLFTTFSVCAQNNTDNWEKIKNQYGNAGMRYIASDVNIAELIPSKNPVFTSAPYKANVLVSTRGNTFEHIFILFTKNNQNESVKSFQGYSINAIKVFTDTKEIFFKNGLSIVDNNFVLNGNLPETKKVLNEIFDGSNKAKWMSFHVFINAPNSSVLILKFKIKSY